MVFSVYIALRVAGVCHVFSYIRIVSGGVSVVGGIKWTNSMEILSIIHEKQVSHGHGPAIQKFPIPPLLSCQYMDNHR